MENNNGKSQSATEFLKHMELFKQAKALKEMGFSPDAVIAALKVGPDDEFSVRQVFTGDSGKSAKFPDLKQDAKGKWLPVPNSPENMKLLIESLGFYPSLNLLKNRVYSVGQPINDYDLSRIANEAKRHNLNSTKDHLIAVLNEVAHKNAYHPFKQFVEQKEWDGLDHIEALYKTITINPDFAEHIDLYRRFIKSWLIGIVAKLYEPGHQNGVLTFQGAQGRGKSKWFTKLGAVPECYGEGGINPDSKDDQLKHLDFIMWHASELDGIVRKRDVAALKDFFTKADVAVRPAYGRFDRISKSNCSFCASVNDTQFLNDVTGSRRFYVIPIVAIDYSHKVDIQQVFAQALALFRSCEKWWFDVDEVDEITTANESFNLETPIDDLASRIVAGSDQLSGAQIFESFGWERPSHSDATKLGTLLRKKGIKSERIKRNGTAITVYWIKRPRQTV